MVEILEWHRVTLCTGYNSSVSQIIEGRAINPSKYFSTSEISNLITQIHIDTDHILDYWKIDGSTEFTFSLVWDSIRHVSPKVD